MPHGIPLVAIHPGAANGAAKRWLPERWTHVADTLAGEGVQVALLGGADERPLVERIVAATRGELLGWTPGGADAPLQLNPGRSGRLEEIAEGQVYWSDTYLMPWTLSTKP